MSIIKTVEPTGEVCIRFTDEELAQLNMKEGDSFTWKETDGGVLLEKCVKVDIDISDWSKETLIMLIERSFELNATINDVIVEILETCINDNKMCVNTNNMVESNFDGF